MIEKPQGDPRNWSSDDWLRYNAWEAAQPEPPRLGPYENLEQFYSSDEWRAIVQQSLESFCVDLHVARHSQNAEAIAFYQAQIAACETELGIETGQRSLF